MEETTRGMAERHEVLFVRMTALHKTCLALATKKPGAAASEGVRIEAENLLGDCVPFSMTRRYHLEMAAPDLGGLAAQLAQAIALLDEWQSRHTFHHTIYNCLMWNVGESSRLPVMRLKPPKAALPPKRDITVMRAKLAKLIDAKNKRIYDEGFKAGLGARVGKTENPQENQSPEPENEQSFPRIRSLW